MSRPEHDVKRLENEKERHKMKKLVSVVETNESAFESLFGEEIFVLSGYFYRGVLKGVNKDSIMLENASIIFDINDFKKMGASQILPTVEWFINLAAVESFGKVV